MTEKMPASGCVKSQMVSGRWWWFWTLTGMHQIRGEGWPKALTARPLLCREICHHQKCTWWATCLLHGLTFPLARTSHEYMFHFLDIKQPNLGVQLDRRGSFFLMKGKRSPQSSESLRPLVDTVIDGELVIDINPVTGKVQMPFVLCPLTTMCCSRFLFSFINHASPGISFILGFWLPGFGRRQSHEVYFFRKIQGQPRIYLRSRVLLEWILLMPIIWITKMDHRFWKL